MLEQQDSTLQLQTLSLSVEALKDAHSSTKDKNTEQIAQLEELTANAHLYIAVLENQAISMKEDIKQCERKKN